MYICISVTKINRLSITSLFHTSTSIKLSDNEKKRVKCFTIPLIKCFDFELTLQSTQWYFTPLPQSRKCLKKQRSIENWCCCSSFLFFFLSHITVVIKTISTMVVYLVRSYISKTYWNKFSWIFHFDVAQQLTTAQILKSFVLVTIVFVRRRRRNIVLIFFSLLLCLFSPLLFLYWLSSCRWSFLLFVLIYWCSHQLKK